MPTYTKREKVSEDSERIVYYVEGQDGDGDPFNGYENEMKQPPVPDGVFVVTKAMTGKQLAVGASSGGFAAALLEAARILLT